LVSLFAAPIAAQSEAAPAPPAELVLANRPIVMLRASDHGITPESRVEGARARIRALVVRGDAGAPNVRDTDSGYVVSLGDKGVFTLLPGDVDPESGETLADVARRTAANLTTAAEETRQARNVRFMTRALVAVGIATGIFLVALWLLSRIVRWVRRRVAPIVEKGAGRAAVGEFHLFTSEQAARSTGLLVSLAQAAAVVSFTYTWLTFALDRFPYTRPWGERMGGFLVDTLLGVGGAAILAVPSLFIVAVIFLGMRWLSKIIGAFLTGIENETVHVPGLHADTIPATRRIVNVLLWFFAVAVAYPYLPGSKSAAFQGMSVFAGLVLSLGATTLVGQVLSGFMLIYSRTFRVGDYVLIGDTEGTVETVGFFTTRIRTNRREQISIPNTLVLGGVTKNYTLHSGKDGVIVHTAVTIGYSTPWRQVHAMLELAAERTPGLRRDPKPFVVQKSLSDYYVEYDLNAHVERPEMRILTLSALHTAIQDVFNEYGVQIMSPHYVADPADTVVVPKARWHEPPARQDGPPNRAPRADGEPSGG
jgi:small-conductance mechanosensitive channel